MNPTTTRWLVEARPFLLALCAAATALAPAAAQSDHYWSNQFGNESVLLSGAVIGSVTDLAAVYYNPARILQRTSPAFVVSAKLYDWTSVEVKDGLGDGEDLAQSSFGGAPGFLGGTFTLPFLEGHQFAYGMLTRHRGDVSYFLREQRSGELIDFLPGAQDHFVGLVDLSTEMKDDWIGLAWAYPLSARWAVGVTGFYFNRSQGRTVALDLRGIGEMSDAATIQAERGYRVSDEGVLGKLGIAWSGSSVSWGLTATTPYWRLRGHGSVRYEAFQVGVPDENGMTSNVLESSVQSDLPVRWKTPWSVGTGLGWSLGTWTLHGAAEYFSSVARHEVLRAEPVLGQSTGEPLDFAVVEQRRAVLNGGVGVRWAPSETFSAFASVATNFSAAPDSVTRFTQFEPTVSNTALRMDFWLLGAGASFHTPWADLTVGGTRQASSESARRVLNLPEEGDEPDSDQAKLIIKQWRFVFGFSFPFGALGGGEEGNP